MQRISSAFLAASLMLLLPMAAWANYAVPVKEGSWNLIGIGGIYTVLDSDTEEGATPNLRGVNHVLVGHHNSDNNITWDRNTTTGDLNLHTTGTFYGLQAGGAGDNGVVGVGWEHNNSQPFHSTAGIRVLGDAGIFAANVAAIGYDRPAKSYGSSMRTMYIQSPDASAPDVMVVYQAQGLEGRTFRISFNRVADPSDETESVFNFDEEEGDVQRVYTARFSYDRTYDNPAQLGDGLTRIYPVDDTVLTSADRYSLITQAFDMNISDNIVDGDELNTSNFQVLEGNLTMYRYSAAEGMWYPTFASNDEMGLNLHPDSDYSTLEDMIDSTSLSAHLSPGYGYWVRFDRDAASTLTEGDTADDAVHGVLTRSSMRSASDYEGKLSDGWNLLAFNDGTLRQATTGLVIPANDTVETLFGAGTNLDVTGPFREASVPFAVAANDLTPGTNGIDVCNTFNESVVDRNTGAAGENQNRLDVRCYVANDGTDVYLVLLSNKPFYLGIHDTTVDVTLPAVTNLSGTREYTTSHLEALDDTAEARYLRARPGEYAMALGINADLMADDDLRDLARINVTPFSIEGYDLQGGIDLELTDADHNTSVGDAAFSDRLNGDAGINGRALAIAIGAGTVDSDAFLIAGEQRFFVREKFHVRLADLHNDVNVTGIYTESFRIAAGSENTAWLDAHEVNGTFARDASNLVGNNAVGSGTVHAFSLNPGNDETPADGNATVMFVSNDIVNYAVQQGDGAQPFGFCHIGSCTVDNNNTVYGAVRSVYQVSHLVRGTTANTASGRSTEDLRFSPIWADDFPGRGAIYHMTENNYTPRSIITAVTQDADGGTVSWKALDLTRDPAEWFNDAGEFELFWTQKERGYWVFLEDGYTNPVTVSGTEVGDYAVNKHFSNRPGYPERLDRDEAYVFNWMDGQVQSTVGGLVRTGYTSGESYTVVNTLDGRSIPLLPTGAIGTGTQNFTASLIDFELSGFTADRAGPAESTTTATDGLGGRESEELQGGLNYVKPATPTLTLEDSAVTVRGDGRASHVVIFDGNVSDASPTWVYTRAVDERDENATESVIDLLADVGDAIAYPDAQTAPTTQDGVPEWDAAYGDIVKDLRFVHANNDEVANGVYSNMRVLPFAAVYSETGVLTVGAGEQNATEPYLYDSLTMGGTTYGPGWAGRDFGVQFYNNGADSINRVSSFVYQPQNVELDQIGGGSIVYAQLELPNGTSIGTIGFSTDYSGEVFYLYSRTTGGEGQIYYGVFPSNAEGSLFETGNDRLTLRTHDDWAQSIADPRDDNGDGDNGDDD